MNNRQIDLEISTVCTQFDRAIKADCLTDDTIAKVNSYMLIAALLGEIAKRLPEPKDPS